MLDRLYQNIGDKIKGLAQAAFVFESIGAIIGGLVLIIEDTDYVALGFLMIIFGPIIALIISWFLYAIGEIADNLELIADNTSDLKKADPPKKDQKKVQVKTIQPTNVASNNDPMPSGKDDWDKFANEIIKMSKEDLLLILEDQQDLYTDEEMDYIKEIYCKKILK